jgi:hypothetical protein
VVLTPRRWCQVGGKDDFRRRRWQKSPVTGESTKETVKTIAQGRPGYSGELSGDYARVLYLFLHARLRVHRAPGFPCALFFIRGTNFWLSSGEIAPRGREAVSLDRCCLKFESETVIAREGGRPSIPPASAIEPKGRGVLDTAHARGTTAACEDAQRANAKFRGENAKALRSPEAALAAPSCSVVRC